MTIRSRNLLAVFSVAVICAGCTSFAKKSELGVVIARRAQIRSSTAVVAADLFEVTRGDRVDILDSVLVPTNSPTAGVVSTEGGDRMERWLFVRAQNDEGTEGWIEARNVLSQAVIERSKKLADEDTNLPSQAVGQLRASSNLRLSPDRTSGENIMMKLESGSRFEIISWKRVAKPQDEITPESDDAPKEGSAQPASRRRQRDDEVAKEPEETNELWYKVRLATAISPAPSGWIFGKQVELAVPGDIIFYRSGREFVAWHRLDEEPDPNSSAARDKDASREAKPGSWVILEKFNDPDQARKLDEPDFDRIYVLGYDKIRQEHYTAYRGQDVKGYLPLRIEGSGRNKSFTVRAADDEGKVNELRFNVFRDERGFLRINAPAGLPKPKRKK